MNIKMLHLELVIIGLLSASLAYGQTYKCRNANGKVVYSDSPCEVNAKTEKVLPSSAASGDPVASNDSRPRMTDLQFLNMKVDEAIASRDFRHARQLAVTQEHWDKISKAENAGSDQVEVPVLASKQQPQRAEAQIQQQVVHQQTVNIRQNITHDPQAKQIELRELQLRMQRDQMERREETQRIQKQVAQQQQQLAQQRQQRQQACLNQVQSRYQAQRVSLMRDMERAGTSQSSMRTVLEQNFARDLALCNSAQ